MSAQTCSHVEAAFAALASTMGEPHGWEQVVPARVPHTETELTLEELRENMRAAWDEIDKVEEMISTRDGLDKPYGMMINALSRCAQAEAAYAEAWQADNKAKAARLAGEE